MNNFFAVQTSWLKERKNLQQYDAGVILFKGLLIFILVQ